MNTETKTENRTNRINNWPQLGAIYLTDGVRRWIYEFWAEFCNVCLAKYNARDWGDMGEEDKAANDAALLDGSRVFAEYNFHGRRVWIITEAVGMDGRRDHTTILFPNEY